MENFFSSSPTLPARLTYCKAPDPPIPPPSGLDKARVLRKLRVTFEEIDESFLKAFERCLALTPISTTPDSIRRFKESLPVQIEHYELFKYRIQEEDKDRSNIEYIQDDKKLAYWRKAIEYLVVENEGFPGWASPNPPPQKYLPSGWKARMSDIQTSACHLPEHILEVARFFPGRETEGVVDSLRRRVMLLDSLLEKTRFDKSDNLWISLGLQIDHSWYIGHLKNDRMDD